MDCEIALKVEDETFLFKCHVLRNEAQNDKANRSWSTADLFILSEVPYALSVDSKVVYVFLRNTASTNSQELTSESLGSQLAFDFLIECLTLANLHGKCLARVVVPRTCGYLIREDIFQLRMADCPFVQNVTSFATLQQKLSELSPTQNIIDSLPEIIKSALGGFIISPTDENMTEDLENLLDSELDIRFSFSWLTSGPRVRKTLALVDLGGRTPDRPGTTSVYLAAQALSIDLVVLANAGHWAEGQKYSHWRKAFIPIDLGNNPDFPFRITEALRHYRDQIDGIVTFCDMFSAAVAQAAEELSLPTSPSSALRIVTDKYESSVFCGHYAFKASSVAEALWITENESLDYPIIVKPCNGWSSEGVTKALDRAGLLDAVAAIDSERHGKDFVIEKYCDGPEVDANFILSEGEVLFFELSDDVPKGAELSGEDRRSAPNNFHELANVLPSSLPAAERDILKAELHGILLRLGFRDGFFHVEARVSHSKMAYKAVEGHNNILDLVDLTEPANIKPSAYLIETNPRPPGLVTLNATKTTYGIDYFGVALLCALGENESVRFLAVPFSTERGSQYWCAALHILAGVGGVFESDDVCKELIEKYPDLAKHISNAACFLRRGALVPSPQSGLNPVVAYLTVYSRVSRIHVLELAQRVREGIRFTIQ